MKSSSSLFPVQLISAEVLVDIAEDVYLLKPNNSPDKSVGIALSNITHYPAAKFRGRPSVVLFHGCYQNRRLWVSPTGDGLARWLVEQGMSVWLMEARGHGLSTVNRNFNRNTVHDYARYDIPAVNAFVTEQTGSKPIWIGANEGGGSLALALAGQTLKDYEIAGTVFMGAPFAQNVWNRVPLLARLRSILQRHQHFESRIGPEAEPAMLLRELALEQGVFSFPGKRAGIDIWKVLEASQCPMALLAHSAHSMVAGVRNLVQSSVLTLMAPQHEAVSLAPVDIYNTLHNREVAANLQALLLPWLKARGGGSEVLSAGRVRSIT